MRQRILGSYTPPCHRRMVITTQFNVLPCCTAAQTSSVPLQVAFDCALAVCTSGSPRTHHPPTRGGGAGGAWSRGPGVRMHCKYPPPPLQSPGVARDGLPGGGGRRSPSDGVPGGGGGSQGYLKANCGTLH